MKLRNIAIIAHVDHGKTTLVDALLKQSADFKQKADAVTELIMDSNDLERERGITIFSKNASVNYKDVKINIIDTPGHADFGGEVERIMRMVDGVLLVVDAKEGPMPQTKFVLRKAIQAGHKAIVVVNKIDKPGARAEWTLNKTFDLFVELGASDDQLDFPVIYASGVQGKAGFGEDLSEMKNVEPLFDTIVKVIPPPTIDEGAPLQFLSISLAYDNFKGKIAIGRLYSGTLKKNMDVLHIDRTGARKKTRIVSLMGYVGMNRVDVESVEAGDICAISGIDGVSIGETITDINDPRPLPVIDIEEPTVKMTFGVNTSPFTGKEGQFTTSRQIKERLDRELETDVALKVSPTDVESRWVVSGRGELHLAILIEKMRREGFELEVSRPQVIFKEEGGRKLEPIEQLSIECPEGLAGTVIQKLGLRRGEMKDMKVDGPTAFLEFVIPTRGLIGYRNEFMTDTRGLGLMNSLLKGYEEYRGEFEGRPHGSLIAYEAGVTRNYGLLGAQERGQLFLGPTVEVYAGQVVGETSRPEDLEVNVCKEKQLSNMRSKGDGVAEALDVAHVMGLEDAIEYVGDDELVEITPKNIRIRKTILDSNVRKRAAGK
ncbi:MAG TPA: translational GTPase TypA [Candidatus Baltobacteraceae bacterium]|nr:translational GTPase TypA [Candidatus Baltobacteraceae bacterium]